MPDRMQFFSPKRPRRREGRPSAFKRGYGGKAWEAIRRRVLIRDNYQCRNCGRVCGDPKEAHIDHITPRRLTQSDDAAGLQVLCSSCHTRKTREGL